MHDNKIQSRLKAQLSKFGGELCVGLSRPLRKFACQMLFGIQASQDVKLSNIARSLKEEIGLIKTEKRLSRNLKSDELERELTPQLVRMGSQRVRPNTVLALDLSDIRKEYAQKMEYLATVRDGSKGELHQGYWLCDVTAAEVNGSEIVPLYQKLYSAEAQDFRSENDEVLTAVDLIRAHTQGRGIWVIDRGGDRKKLLEPLLDRAERFVIRSTGKRSVIDRRKLSGTVAEVAGRCRLTHKARIVKIQDGQEKTYELRYGAEPIHLPDRCEKLWLVVIVGFGEERLMLLTNVPVAARDSQSAWWIAQIYLTRWKIEETFRFVKQSYNLEDIRVMKYQRLKNLVILVTAAAYFAATFLGQQMKLRILCEKLLIISQRFFGIPPFRFYALADGIRQVLSQATLAPPETPPA
ncbi:MAG: transposase, partial [Candidatus Korobacteraceae bacterium]